MGRRRFDRTAAGIVRSTAGPIYDGQFTYNPCTQALDVCESSAYLDDLSNVQKYTQSYGNADYSVNDVLWGLFVQDNFRATQKLTLNLGLRYEQQTFTDARGGFCATGPVCLTIRRDKGEPFSMVDSASTMRKWSTTRRRIMH